MNQTPAGWYPAQGDPPNTVRYWDGNMWQGDAVPAGQQQQPFGGGQPFQDPNETLVAQRIGAKFIDGLILLIPIVIVVFAVVGSQLEFNNGEWTTDGEELSTGMAALVSGLFTAIIAGYNFLSYSTMSTTLGKKAFGMKVVGPGGRDMNTNDTVKRVAVHTVVNLVTIVVAFISPIFGLYYIIAQPIMAAVGDKKTLRDMISDTRVVRSR